MSNHIKIWSALTLVLLCVNACTQNTAVIDARTDWDLMKAQNFTELAHRYEQTLTSLNEADLLDVSSLCEAYAELKSYAKLLSCLDVAEHRFQRGERPSVGDPQAMVDFLHLRRAEAYIDLGDYDRAIEEARKTDATDKIKNSSRLLKNSQFAWQVRALAVLAKAYAFKGDRAHALETLALIESTSIANESSALPAEESFELYKASIYLILGYNEESLKAMRRSMEAHHKWLAKLEQDDAIFFADPKVQEARKEHPELIRGRVEFLGYSDKKQMNLSDFNLTYIFAKSLYANAMFREAKLEYDRLLAQAHIHSLQGMHWVILVDRGKIAEREGQRKEAIDYYRRAIEVIERQRSTINTETSRIGFVGDKQQVYHWLVAALIAEGQAAQAFEYVERAKARALVDLLASKQDFAAAGAAPQQVAALVKDWDQVEEDSRVPAASSEESSRRSARGVQVKANLQAASPELASLVMVAETASSAVQALLAPDETLLEYYYQGDDLYAFVVTRETVKGAKLNGAGLAKEVEAFRKALQDPKSGDVVAFSRNLYGRLIQPVSAQVPTKRLLIVGHGALHYLPFAALSDGAGYLVDQYSLRLLPSASVLQFLKGRQAQQGGSLLAFGNPDLGDAQYDLKFAQDEVQAIAKIFPQAKVLVRQEATKGAFKSLGPQFSYLHLATHGKFDPDAPLKSGLLLAKNAQEDGFLSLGDLYSLRLNADLVILSACETGLGKISNGDDVVGLTRGFLYAGSSSIVASLWEVDDRATSLLMTEFYANLKKGDKREALRQAQLTTKKQYPHPFYWAAFQLTGMP